MGLLYLYGLSFCDTYYENKALKHILSKNGSACPSVHVSLLKFFKELHKIHVVSYCQYGAGEESVIETRINFHTGKRQKNFENASNNPPSLITS
jgi:hypothetical protein